MRLNYADMNRKIPENNEVPVIISIKYTRTSTHVSKFVSASVRKSRFDFLLQRHHSQSDCNSIIKISL